MSIKDRKTLYHLTELDNLKNILEYGLLSRDLLVKHNLRFEDVADQEIIKFRKEKDLEKYIPFHFFPYTPFDWVVQNNNADKSFIYICIHKDLANGNNFSIIPRHPLSMRPFIIYDYEEGMNIIDWQLMDKKDYKDITCKNVCMAECITELVIPYNCFQSISVKDLETQEIVLKEINDHNVKIGRSVSIHVDIRNQWFT